GIVIIDFIDLHKVQNRQLLFNEMTQLMASDKAKHTILPLTKFGLMQITRQRVRPVAVQDVTDVCPTCNGSGRIEPTVLLDRKIENQIQFLAEDRGVKHIVLKVSPYVASYLNKGFLSLRRRWMMRYKMWIKVVADQSLGMVDVKYFGRNGELLIE
ncbi:MAG: ribonuclease E/G, partial [Alistipes sp.]|nr:ribonuclease E/G [Alistipes sp.]